MRNRQRVAAGNPLALSALAADLGGSISHLSSLLATALGEHWDGSLGPSVKDTTKSLFDLWCEQSLVATVDQAADLVAESLKARPTDSASVAAVLRNSCDVPKDDAQRSADKAASAWAIHPTIGSIAPHIWEAYRAAREKFCAQTAHVLIARLLLYRVGEDKGLFPRQISNSAWADEHAKANAQLWPHEWVVPIVEGVRSLMTGLVPSVYERGEFDWWIVDGGHRSALPPNEMALADRFSDKIGNAFEDSIDTLDGYHFGSVDVDVWHDVYQHYLPAEERQRLGGFYTPDELVTLLLEMADWRPDVLGLCSKRVLDPACGSGTFLVQATQVLRQHLAQSMGCHEQLEQAKTSWERSQGELQIVAESVHGIDLHPFAAFLSTLNVLFVVLDPYVAVKKNNPTFVLDLAVFTHNSLDKAAKEVIHLELFTQMNSRVALTEHSVKKFAAVVSRRFDLVIGNPPWGGILKGRLAPVFDAATKRRYRKEYPNAAVGKYDIYGLFFERGLGWLRRGGRLALITQNTYWDKDWAKHLRLHLASAFRVRTLVDIAAFGGLFFDAMNTPAMTVIDQQRPSKSQTVLVVRVPEPEKWAVKGAPRRRRAVAQAIALVTHKAGSSATRRGVHASSWTIPQQQLEASAPTRWMIDPARRAGKAKSRNYLSVADLLEARQGVTPGGALDLYLIPRLESAAHKLEDALAKSAFKSRGIERWLVKDQGLVMVYPYDATGRPAFSIKHAKLSDALDFDVSLDPWEASRRGSPGWVGDILEGRIAKGLVKYPSVARYLASNYERLQSRSFKHRNIRDFNRRWYEHLWPRDIAVLNKTPRIVSPSLIKTETRFALEDEGRISDHAAIFLVVTSKTARRFSELQSNLTRALGRPASDEDALMYILHTLNSEEAWVAMLRGRNPTPKGYYPVNEQYLKELSVDFRPRPARVASALAEVGAAIALSRSAS